MQEAGELCQLAAKLCRPFGISVTSSGLRRGPPPFLKNLATVDSGWAGVCWGWQGKVIKLCYNVARP